MIGYDNAHSCPLPKSRKKYGCVRVTWDHRHHRMNVEPYHFDSPEQLMEDFWKDVNQEHVMSHKILKVGIMSKVEFIARTMEIVKGEYKPKASEPKVWFESLQTMAQVLSSENQKLLKIIADRKPNSLKELEDITGRKVSNLSRTLHKMEGYGIVELRKEKKQLKPVVTAMDIHLSYSICD